MNSSIWPHLGTIGFIVLVFIVPLMVYRRWIKTPSVAAQQTQLEYWIEKAQKEYDITVMVNPQRGVRFWVKHPANAEFVRVFYDEVKERFAVEILSGFYDAGRHVRVISDRINRLNALAERLNEAIVQHEIS